MRQKRGEYNKPKRDGKKCMICGTKTTFINPVTGYPQWRRHPNPKLRLSTHFFCHNDYMKLYKSFKRSEKKRRKIKP